MHRSESYELTACLICGSEISISVDRSFAVTRDSALCFACALKRGGSYDETRDTWRRAPSLVGLPLRE